MTQARVKGLEVRFWGLRLGFCDLEASAWVLVFCATEEQAPCHSGLVTLEKYDKIATDPTTATAES